MFLAWRLWPPPLQPRRSMLTLGARLLLIALLVFALDGVRVDVVTVGEAPTAEAMVASVDTAQELRDGQTATATVHLRSTGQAAGRLTLIVDDKEVASRDVTLPAGASTQVFDLPPMPI